MRLQRDADDVVASRPDVILAGVGGTNAPLRQATHTVPVVFAQSVDPVGNGFVDNMARPGGNTTGFIQFEYSLAGKWLELLKEVAPGITRVGVVREPGIAGVGQWVILQAVAQSAGVELKPIGLANAAAIERDVSAFARTPNSGLVVVVSASSLVHRELIVGLAARHQLPAAYAYRTFVESGGLISYGPDVAGQYRRAAGYVNRILKGERPGRPAGAGADQVRSCDQSQDRQGARPLSAAVAARASRRGDRMKRRAFIVALGGAAAWPVAARAQQPTTLVIGFVRSTSRSPFENLDNSFQIGLKEAGFIDGQNVTIVYRYADDQSERLQFMIAEFIRQPVTVIVANNVSALVAVSKTTTVPIVFVTGGDPVTDGLVANLNRPGGNVTGVVFFSSALGAKRLELLRELVPQAITIAVLTQPGLPNTEAEFKAVEQAAEAVGLRLVVAKVNNDRDIDGAFDIFKQRGVGALFVGAGPTA